MVGCFDCSAFVSELSSRQRFVFMCSANSFARPFQSHASGSRPRRELWKYWTKLDVCESFKCVKKIFFGSNAHFSDCPMAEQRLFLTCENAYPRPINCHSPPFPCTIVYTLSSTRDTNQIRVEIQRLEKWHAAPDVGHDSHSIRTLWLCFTVSSSFGSRSSSQRPHPSHLILGCLVPFDSQF